MKNIIEFNFDGNEVRTVTENDEPWFVAKDVCNVLGYCRSRDAIRILDHDEKGAHSVRTPGGNQKISTVSESGLYALIFRSKKPEAKKFRKWVTKEVLPEIRKNGGYISEHASEDQIVRLEQKLNELRHSNAKLRGKVGGLTKGKNSMARQLEYKDRKIKMSTSAMLNTRSFPAKFDSKCKHCGKDIKKGDDTIGKLINGRYQFVCHAECFEKLADQKVTAKLVEDGYFNDRHV